MWVSLTKTDSNGLAVPEQTFYWQVTVYNLLCSSTQHFPTEFPDKPLS